MAVREFMYGEYARVDYRDAGNMYREHRNPEDRCETCTRLDREMTKLYGPAVTGLKKWHSDTGIDLSLLQTCRLAYHEAYLLPLELYTFDFAGSLQMSSAAKVIKQLPLTGGLRRITAIYLQHVCANDLFRSAIAFPAIKSLKVSRADRGPVSGTISDWKRFFSVDRTWSTQVMTGSGDGGSNTLAACRADSSALESFLSSSSWAEAEGVANA